MSVKRLAVLAATHSDGYIGNNNMTSLPGPRAGPSLHGNVNVLLSGAMLSGLVLLVFLICYCCHRNVNKGTERRSDLYCPEPLEVFSVDQQCSEVFLPPDPYPQTAPSPPPTYEAAVTSGSQKKGEEEDDSGLPTYQAALQLAAQGYV